MSDVDPSVTPPGTPTPELAVVSWPSRFDLGAERALAEPALAVPLLTLRDDGAVTMEVVTKKVMTVRHTHVLVSPAEGTAPNGAGSAGLRGQLLAVLRKPETVSDLVYRWFRSAFGDPARHVVETVEAIGTELGYYRRVVQEGGALSRVFGHKVTYEPITEHRALLEPLADALGERWRALARDEPDLYRELLADVTRAIERRHEDHALQ